MNALLGALGGLIGVIVGAVITDYTARRRDRAAARQAHREDVANAVVSLAGALVELAGTMQLDMALRTLREAQVAYVLSWTAGPPGRLLDDLAAAEGELRRMEDVLVSGKFINTSARLGQDKRSTAAREAQLALQARGQSVSQALIDWSRSLAVAEGGTA